jgi:hypothetical protein
MCIYVYTYIHIKICIYLYKYICIHTFIQQKMDLDELEYLRGVKDKVFLWLAEKSLTGDD